MPASSVVTFQPKLTRILLSFPRNAGVFLLILLIRFAYFVPSSAIN
jgi:hypothetical protein